MDIATQHTNSSNGQYAEPLPTIEKMGLSKEAIPETETVTVEAPKEETDNKPKSPQPPAPKPIKFIRKGMKVHPEVDHFLEEEYLNRPDPEVFKEQFIGEYVTELLHRSLDPQGVEMQLKATQQEVARLQTELAAAKAQKENPVWKKRFFYALGAAGLLLLGFFYQLRGKIKAQEAL